MPNDLSLLVCGNCAATSQDGEPALGQILAYIQSSMDSVLDHLSWLRTEEPKRILMLAPFLGRSLLELATTALIGRLDPLRLLVVRQIQSQPEYVTSISWKTSIRWQGDVLTSEGASKQEKELWGSGLEYEKVHKALLGQYYDQLLWRPAHQRMNSVSRPGGVWLNALAVVTPKSFVALKRIELGKLYSSLSKGIHHEFVMPPESVYDRDTIVDFIQRSAHVVADLALVSHFIPHALFALSPDEAIDAYNRIENMEVIK